MSREPSFTARTRNSIGSNVNVSVIIESRDALTMEIGTVYGPAPTRNVVPGGEERTAQEYEALLAKAGFKLAKVVPTESVVSIIEAIKA